MLDDLSRIGDGIFRLHAKSIGETHFAFLLREAERAVLKRSRICIHNDTSEAIQEMFVCMLRGSPKYVYRYPRPASMLVLDGAYKIEFYDMYGETVDEVTLGHGTSFVRIPAMVYHHPTILTDYVLLHEIHNGPWTKDYVMGKA